MTAEFSVIIPTYRRPRELLEAISSVLLQKQVTVEIVVVDDSPEASAREPVLKLANPSVTYLKNPSPSGGYPSIVRNLGWPSTAGTFIHFLDDDDIVPEGHYVAVRSAFSDHPEAGMVFGRIEPFGDASDVQLAHERQFFERAARRAAMCARFGSRWAFLGTMLFDQLLLVCSASIVRRECVEQLGGFDPSIRLMEDADFHIRAMRTFGAYFLDDVSLKYRISGQSLMHSQNPSNAQRKEELEGHRRIHSKYRSEHGLFEYYALQLFARTMLKFV